MRILYIAPAHPALRRDNDRPYKGSIFFRHPDYDFLRTKAIHKDIDYIDERITTLEYRPCDLVLIPVLTSTLHRAVEIGALFRRERTPVIFFGPLARIGQNYLLNHCDSVVIGDIGYALSEIISDLETNSLKRIYLARGVSFPINRSAENLPGFVRDYSRLRLLFGCGCPDHKEWCYEYYLFPEPVFCPVGIGLHLLSTMKRKRVVLIDDGIDSNPDYYLEFFKWSWPFHKEWIVTASGKIFDHPDLLLAMKRAGVRVIILKPDFYKDRSYRQLGKDLTFIHHLRMIPGVTIRLDPEITSDLIDEVLSLPADFALFPTLTPIPFTEEYESLRPVVDDFDFFDYGHPVIPDLNPGLIERVKDRYYSLDQIYRRLTRSIARIGFYNTFSYLLPINLALRQNFLEGIPYPP
ncbi:MAG TPA: hypothetical protein EYP24_05990 [bacterium (Candidatus Stahlbacteria)]|nr:hypothetical protein [Candidatus Stahlbacteria bacterium]